MVHSIQIGVKPMGSIDIQEGSTVYELGRIMWGLMAVRMVGAMQYHVYIGACLGDHLRVWVSSGDLLSY